MGRDEPNSDAYSGMMRAVWNNPLCETTILACADALHEDWE